MPEEFYYHNLPHYRSEGVYYFVTWILHTQQAPLEDAERKLVADVIEHFHSQRYHLAAYVVMDDHVHLVVRLEPERALTHTIMSWKSFSAHCLHKDRDRERAIWQNEFYDRIVRDERELHETIEYIRRNPPRRWPDIQDYPWLKVFEE